MKERESEGRNKKEKARVQRGSFIHPDSQSSEGGPGVGAAGGTLPPMTTQLDMFFLSPWVG